MKMLNSRKPNLIINQFDNVCHLIFIKVDAKDSLILVLRDGSELQIAIHDKGEEYFLLKGKAPKNYQIHHLRKDDYATAISLEKQTNLKTDENCKQEPYAYFGSYELCCIYL